MRLASEETARLYSFLLNDPGREYYGYEIIRDCDGVSATTVYRTLRKMEDRGWMSRRNEVNPEEGLPPRKVYKLTGTGVPAVNHELARFCAANPGWVFA